MTPIHPPVRPRPHRVPAVDGPLSDALAVALFVALSGVLGGVTAGAAHAQASAEPPYDRIVLRTIHEGWRHQDQPPLTDGTRSHHEDRLEIRERWGRQPTDDLWVDLRLGGVDATEVIRWGGDAYITAVRPRALDYRPLPADRDGMAHSRYLQLRGDRAALALPANRFRDLRIIPPDTAMAPGDSWTDTLAFEDFPGEGLEESYREVRRITVLSDTVLSGRRALWLRTEGQVTYTFRDAVFVESERMDIHRVVSGTNVGRVAVEARTGLRMAGADTALWRGEAVLHDPVRGPLTSGATYERVRGWRHFTREEHGAFLDSLRVVRQGSWQGMILIPDNEVERRLRAGDTAVADSLRRVWRESPDPDEARAARRALAWATEEGRWTEERMDSLDWAVLLERGDTTALVALARDGLDGRMTLERARFLLPFLEDPRRLWRLGAPLQWEDRTLADALLRSSPIFQPDSAEWACRPEVCDFWMERLAASADPRLRDAALAGRFGRDPARWISRLEERAAAGSRVLETAWRMAEGRLVEGGPPIPGRDATWQEWAAWSASEGFAPSRAKIAAVQLREALTGEEPLAGLVAAWPPADDSARAFAQDFLRLQGRIPQVTPWEARDLLLAGESVPTGGLSGIDGLLYEHGEPMADDDATALLEPLLRSLVERVGVPWPSLGDTVPDEGRPPPSSGARATRDDRFVQVDDLPERVVRSLPPGVTPITRREWALRDPRLGGEILSVRRPTRWGPFASVSWSRTSYDRREPDQPPGGVTSGGGAVLVETPDGWRVVSRWSMIT